MEYLYILRSDDGRRFKIGISCNPYQRFKQLNNSTPYAFHVYAILRFSDRATVREYESNAHKLLARSQLVAHWRNKGLKSFDGWTEWFQATEETISYIRELVRDFCDTWNMLENSECAIQELLTKKEIENYNRYAQMFYYEPTFFGDDDKRKFRRVYREQSYNDEPECDIPL